MTSDLFQLLTLSKDLSILLLISLESKDKFFIVKKITRGKIISIENPIICQIDLQDKNDNKNIIKTGSINSAVDSPNHTVLNAFPLLWLKYLVIVVVEVWDISPWPENLIKKTPIINKYKLFMKEKKKLENINKKITIRE